MTRRSAAADVDVLVIGCGAAGLSAAITAREAGATVLVAEGGNEVGGSSRLSGGVVMGAGTSVQRAAGIVDDDADFMFREYMALNQWQVVPGIVRRLADESGATIEWLIAQGVEFHCELLVGGDESRPRSHLAKGAGQGIIDALHRRCRELGIDIALGRRVDRLLDHDGRVDGAAVGGDEIRASATVLATGGFGANPDLLRERFPSAWHDGWTWYIGGDGAQGDAFDLTAGLGAAVEGHDRGLRTLEPHWIGRNEAIMPGWMVLVDGNGRRFVDETAPYGLLDAAVRSRGDRVFAIFDDAAIHPSPERAHWYRHCYKAEWPGHGPFEPRNWRADVIEQMTAEGRTRPHDSIASLAADLGLDARALRGTVDRYNRFVDDGADADYRKDGKFLARIATPPFYGALLRPTVVNLTASGLRIDADAHVVGADGAPIDGLFAAGECVGGVIGPVYVGSGNSLGACTTVGRIAGASAARFAASARGS